MELTPLKNSDPKSASVTGVCPNCGGSNMRLLYDAGDWSSSDRFGVVQCADCTLGVIHPIPEDLDKYYPQNYRSFNVLVAKLMIWMYRARVRSWLKFFPNKGRALEIGSGNGWMLNALSDYGWDVVGFEREEAIAKRLSETTGHKVHSGSVAQLKGAKFDLILMFNVIEHIREPFQLMRECSELLEDGGTVILSTQNFSSWQSRMTGPHWSHLDVPRHVYHFSRSSFEEMFRNCGLETVRTTTVSWIHDPYGWVVSFQNQLGFRKDLLTTSLMQKSLAGFLNLQGLLLIASTVILLLPAAVLSVASWIFNTGGLIEIWARKKSKAG